jgi:hypothetical protein
MICLTKLELLATVCASAITGAAAFFPVAMRFFSRGRQ